MLDTATGTVIQPTAFSGMRRPPTAPLVAGVYYSNVINVTNADTGADVKQLALARKHVQDCTFSPDGRFLVAVSNEASVRVWETETWTEQQLAWGIGKLKCVCFAPDGLRTACASESRADPDLGLGSVTPAGGFAGAQCTTFGIACRPGSRTAGSYDGSEESANRCSSPG